MFYPYPSSFSRAWNLYGKAGSFLQRPPSSYLHTCRCRYANFGAARALQAEDSTDSELSSRPHLAWHAALTNPDFAAREAFRDSNRSYTYRDIASAAYANHLKLEEDFKVEKTIKSKSKTLHGKRIGIFTPHDVSFVISLWSTWLSGGIAVPLGLKHPEPQLEYFLKNSDTSVIFCSEQTKERAERIKKACGAEILPIKPTFSTHNQSDLHSSILPLAPPEDDSALILYTSGTTALPKGVLWKHKALNGQVKAMEESWEWSPEDKLLHVLPLCHLHGLINCLITPLSCGAAVWMDQDFRPENVWRQLLSSEEERINVFMAVPTIYVKLLEHYHANQSQLPPPDKIKSVLQSRMRLFVSGSAPLPDSVFKAWHDLTGHELLERYGMTETGMILTNPLKGKRIPGTVGRTFPEVQTRIVPVKEEKVEEKSEGKTILGLKIGGKGEKKEGKGMESDKDSNIGELQVLGPNMFSGYWNNEKATRESFSDDGWFRTGDTAEFRDGIYRILGRTSTEIIKSGGYKISALDIERRMLEHSDIAECAVFGIPDPVWGEKVSALVRLKDGKGKDMDEEKLQKIIADWIEQALPAYMAPKMVKIIEELPRNPMGKINKRDLQKQYGGMVENVEEDKKTKPDKKA